MAALFDVPGAVDIFVKFKNEAANYLGTCTVSPEYESVPYWVPIMNDISGRNVPMELLYDGQIDRVSCVMNRVDTAVMRRVRDYPSHNGGLNLVGEDPRLDRGTLVVNSLAMQLIFVNGFFGTTNATANTPPGRLYYSAVLNSYKESAAGTRVQEHACLFECHSVFTASRGFQLFSEHPADFGTLTPN